MSDPNVLKTRYFVQAADAVPPSEPVPDTYDNCLVTPLIDMAAYNAAVKQAIDDIATGPGSFIYIHNWFLGLIGGEYDEFAIFGSEGPGVDTTASPGSRHAETFFLDGPPPTGTTPFAEILKEKARMDVDVRVLGWVSFAVMSIDLARKSVPYTAMNALTIKAILDLRAEPKIGGKAVMNDIAHTAGAAHPKFVVIGDPSQQRYVAFTGGLDFAMDRWAHSTHPAGEPWHDVAVKIEGEAVQSLYNFFVDMWQENVTRKERRIRFDGKWVDMHEPRSPALRAISLPMPPATVGSHSVQSLRTVPQFHYTLLNTIPENPPITFAPDGLFEFRAAVEKAIKAAEHYIYIEDEAFWSRDMLGYVHEALTRPNSIVKVVLVRGGRADPADPEIPWSLLVESLNYGLLGGASDPGVLDRVRVFMRVDITVHAKTILIDDNWALIGSANCRRRSLFTDLEHSVAVVDPGDAFVREYRKALWSDQFRYSSPDDLDDPTVALGFWEPAWLPATTAPFPSLAGRFVTMPLPISEIDHPRMTPEEKSDYDRFVDPDSRDPWGFAL